VIFSGTTIGATDGSYSSYYYDFDDGYAYAVESNTGIAPDVTHVYDTTSETPYSPTLVCRNSGRVVNFGPANGGEVTFSTGGPIIADGTAVVLSGASPNRLTVMSTSDYTVESDHITLNTGITAGYYLQLVYAETGYRTSAVYAADVLLPSNGLSVGLTPSGIAECYNHGITFTPYVFGGTPPYTYSWNFDSTSKFGNTSADATWVTVNGVVTKTSSSASPGEVVYYTYGVGIANVATVSLTVTDAASHSTTATAILTFGTLPAVWPSGYAMIPVFSRRYISNSNVGALFTRATSVLLGTAPEAGHSYRWSPSDDLNSIVIAQPTCTLSVTSRKYTETITAIENGASCVEYVGCQRSADCYVVKPSCILGAVTLSSDLGTCLKAVSVKINNVTPAAEGLALVVERVVGGAGTVADVGVTGSLPVVVDYTSAPACSFSTAGHLGGILLLDAPYRTFNSSNRVAYKITSSTTFPLYITVLDPVCSSTSSITHDYRVRLIDVAGVESSSVTEAMMVDNSRASVAVSNDITLQITGVSSCLSSATINVAPSGHAPNTYYYGQTLTFSATVSGAVAPLSYSWSFDGLGNFGSGGYSYQFVGGTTATSASPQVQFLGPTSALNKIARIGLTVHDSSNGGAGVSIIAPNVDLTMEYIAPCVISCSTSVPTTAVVGNNVSFAASASTTGCTSSVTWDWNFGDNTNSTDQNPTHVYSNAGSYTWTLTVSATGPLGTTNCTRTGQIAVATPCTITSCGVATGKPYDPNAFLGGVCYCKMTAPFEAVYATSGTCGETPTFTWYFGDGTYGYGQSTTHTYSSGNTTYNWSLTVNIGGASCTATGKVAICDPSDCVDPGGGCFVAGTMVSMADGTSKPIEKVKIDDEILGVSVNGHIVVARVLDTLVHNDYSNFELLEVSAGKATMIMTPEHKVWVEDQQDYMEVVLAIANRGTIRTLSGDTGTWALKRRNLTADTVFNLTTSTRNYFVNGVLVSNLKKLQWVNSSNT
jgi:PKD repeat protein